LTAQAQEHTCHTPFPYRGVCASTYLGICAALVRSLVHPIVQAEQPPPIRSLFMTSDDLADRAQHGTQHLSPDTHTDRAAVKELRPQALGREVAAAMAIGVEFVMHVLDEAE